LHPSHILTWKALNLCCCISWPPFKDESNMATLSLLCLSIYPSVSLSVWNTHNSLPVSSPTWRKRRRRRSSSTRTEWDLDHF
jgi:hypothetical protein